MELFFLKKLQHRLLGVWALMALDKEFNLSVLKHPHKKGIVIIIVHSFSHIIFYLVLSQETGCSRLCYTAGSHCLSILNVIVFIYIVLYSRM